MTRMYYLFILIISAIFFSFLSPIDEVRKKYAETITPIDLRRHLAIIASDEYEGRETGTKGQHMTAEYIAKQFMSFGIPPLPGTASNELSHLGYFQKVPLLRNEGCKGNISTPLNEYIQGKDFYCAEGTASQTLNINQIVFAGYGIQDSLYKDYLEPSLSGKAVIIFDGEPIDKKGRSIITGDKQKRSVWSKRERKKINEAKKRGATAILIVKENFQWEVGKENQEFSESLLLDDDEKTKDTIKVPVLYIRNALAEKIYKEGTSSVYTEGWLKRSPPKYAELNLLFRITLHCNNDRIYSENVLGYLEGSDLKNQLLVITAHMDHLGVRGKKIYNGADDDGSGTVAVIELAEAFAKAKLDGHGPRRSILFMCLTGEEKGLWGSQWYTSHPVFPLENTVVNFNIDMIGRGDEEHAKDSNFVYVIGSDRISSELKAINEKNNLIYTGLALDYRFDVPNEPNNYFMRSDHYNFAKNNIPVSFFFNGVHEDYHQETDELSKINFPLLSRRAQLVFYSAWEIANKDSRLVIDKKQ